MSDDSVASSCRWADINGGYATGSEASTEETELPASHAPSYDLQTIDTITSSMSMLSVPEYSLEFLASNKASLVPVSVGSESHQAGRCKPCAFFHKQGCQNGTSCIFCHQCPPHEKQRRKRLRRRMIREHFAPESSQVYDIELHKHTDPPWSYAPNFPSEIITTEPSSHVSNGEQWHNQSWAIQDVSPAADGGAQSHQFAAQEPGLVMAACPPMSPSLLSTAPNPASACRFVQDESPYSSPVHNMSYQSGPVQYAFVQVPVPVQQMSHTSQQQQEAHGGVSMAMVHTMVDGQALPMDPSSWSLYGDGYVDASGTPWGSASGTQFMCVVSPHGDGSGPAEHDMMQVSAF